MHRREFVQRSAHAAAAFGILRYAGGCRPADQRGGSQFVSIRDRYFLQFLQRNPVVSTYLGGDGYSRELAAINGKLRDFRPEALTSEVALYRGIRGELEQIDRADLSAGERIDYNVLQAQLAFLLHQIEDLHHHERAVDTYVAEPFRGVDWQIQQMQDFPGGHRGSQAEWELVVTRLDAVPAYLQVAKSNLIAGKDAGRLPDRRMVQRDGIEGSRANAEFFGRSVLETASPMLGTRPFAAGMRNKLEASAKAAAAAYQELADFLARTYDLSEKTDRFAAGEEEYNWRLTHCLNLPQRAAQLFEYGAEQVALYQSRIYEVAAAVAGNAKLPLRFSTDQEKRDSVRRVMDHLSKDSPTNDDELFRWYREACDRAVDYGRQHRLFDVPSTYQLEVVPTPPVLRSTIDAAYYPAPPLKRTGAGRFYLTPTENDPAALKLNNRASVADTAVHEGFPGHDWHYRYMSQHASEISNIRWLTPGSVEDSSSMWADSMATEGWGLYSEELMAEPSPGRPNGFYMPAELLYELQGQLLRAVRVRVDVGIHTGRMTFDEAVDYFTENVSFYPKACSKAASDSTARAVCENAQRAIYRYSKWPTQAITYNLGKKAIIELRESYRARQGSRFSAREFHEKLMRVGTIPAGYFRESF